MITVYAQTSVMKLAASGAHNGPSSVASTPTTASLRTATLHDRKYVAQAPRAPTRVVRI